MRNVIFAAIVSGAATGVVSGWWWSAHPVADLSVRPPIAVIDYAAALQAGDEDPKEAARRVHALDQQVAALESAGFLVLRASAVAAAPEAVRVPMPEGEH